MTEKIILIKKDQNSGVFNHLLQRLIQSLTQVYIIHFNLFGQI